MLGPIIIEYYKKEVSKGMKNDKHLDTLTGYTKSIFQDFRSHLRTKWIWLKMILDWF